MGFFKNLFTWWEGASTGTRLSLGRGWDKVGADDAGNEYYQSSKNGRRWVIYSGSNDASRIPPEWYSWMHHQIADVPDKALPPVRTFQKPPVPNLTGTSQA
jgi:NADH:ubiquinone oxidoreductase subunit